MNLKQFLLIEDKELQFCFVFVEAITDNIINNINTIINLIQKAITTSSGIKRGLVPVIKSIISKSIVYTREANHIPNGHVSYDAFKESAGKLIAAIEFLFMIENLFLFLQTEYQAVLEKQNANKAEQDEDQQQEPTVTEESENPTIEQIIGPVESKNFQFRMLKILNRKSSVTKSVPSQKFRQSVKDLIDNRFSIFPQSINTRLAFQILKLSVEDLNDLLKKLSIVIPRIKQLRIALGNIDPKSLRKNILGEPQNEK